MKNLLMFVIFTAVIYKTDVGILHTSTGDITKACAYFHIQQDGKTIESNYQCGASWEDVKVRIQLRIQEKQSRYDSDHEQQNIFKQLSKEQDSIVGEVIKP